MEWASGSELAGDLWSALAKVISPDKQQEIAALIIYHLVDYDCDTLDECPDLIEAAGPDFIKRYFGD